MCYFYGAFLSFVSLTAPVPFILILWKKAARMFFKKIHLLHFAGEKKKEKSVWIDEELMSD